MRKESKRLQMGRLSWRISTMAGPDMKSLSTSTTKTPSLEGPLAGFIGVACLRSGGDIAFRAFRDPHRAPEGQFATNPPSRRPPWCRTVVIPAFMPSEIGTKWALRKATTPAAKNSEKAIPYRRYAFMVSRYASWGMIERFERLSRPVLCFTELTGSLPDPS
jgi:hypothetical protein